MKLRICKLIHQAAPLAMLAVCMTMPLTTVKGGDNSKSASGKLEGVWFIQVSIRDCGTSAVLRTFPSITTVSREGTLIDTTTGFSPALRSPGHGTWEKTGRSTYEATTWAFLFNAAGVWTGTQKLSHTITVDGAENEFTSTLEVYNPDGDVVSTGCATAVGRRL